MKLKIFDEEKNEKGELSMPAQFDEPVRADLIKRAVDSQLSSKRQPYGRDPDAGNRQTGNLSRRRRDYKGSYGHGMSRIPRKIMSRNGTNMSWVGAIVASTVGGRRAHPPKAERVLAKAINIKERRKAIRSALAATVTKDAVKTRGHRIPDSFPFIISSSLEKIKTTKDATKALEKLEFTDELIRSSIKKVRAGKGKGRGRRYKRRVGPLIVVSKTCPLIKAATNIPGVDVLEVNHLNAASLAPGGHAGRLTLYTEAAIERITKEGLFK